MPIKALITIMIALAAGAAAVIYKNKQQQRVMPLANVNAEKIKAFPVQKGLYRWLLGKANG